jgi:outer membrane protein assembly factor BamB
VVWKFKTEGEIKSSPAVAGGKVYFGSYDSHLYALDAASGQLRWKLKTGDKVHSSPIVQEEIVYVGSDDGALYAVDAVTGTEKWKSKTYGYFVLLDKNGICCEEYLKTNLPSPDLMRIESPFTSDTSGWSVYASPVITGGMLYFGAEGAYFYAAHQETGEIAWVEALESGITSTAATDGDNIYVVNDAGSLFSLNAKTVLENWRFYAVHEAYTMHSFYNSSVVVANETVYIAGRLGEGRSTLFAVDTSTGKEKWRFHEMGATTSPVVSDNSVYFTAGENLYALDTQTGGELWESNLGNDIPTAPALADGILYVTSGDGYLYALDAGTGRELWKFKAVSEIIGSPTIGDGMVYLGSKDGYLYALR